MTALLVGWLVALLPACPTEDSEWCVWPAQDMIIVNLEMRDPAPASIVVPF